MKTVATIIGHGIYSLSEASKLTNVPISRTRSWFKGTSENHQSIFKSDYSKTDTDVASISFLDLTDLFIVSRLRNHGFSLQHLKKVLETLKDDFNTDHPYSHEHLLTDGKTIFFKRLNDLGDIELTDVLKRQNVFNKVLSPYLKQLEWNTQTRLPERWRITKSIVLDPQRRFGKPILESSSIATSILYQAYLTNDRDIEAVADWYDISPSDVEIAVKFELKYFGKAA